MQLEKEMLWGVQNMSCDGSAPMLRCVLLSRHGAGSHGHAAGHDDGKWHAHAAGDGHGCSGHDGHAHAASLSQQNFM